MKKTTTAIAAMCCILASFAQVTPFLEITLDTTKLRGFCNLGGAHQVYMHSGLGTSSPSAAWEHIVGNWGLNNGKGLMRNNGDKTFTLCMNIVNYYTQLASPDSLSGGEGRGPMPAGATPYNIGLVFRSDSCWQDPSNPTKFQCIEGKDKNCKDIAIFAVNKPNPQTYELTTGEPFEAVTARHVQGCATSIRDISHQLFRDIRVYPNPFSDKVHFEFNMLPKETALTAEVLDVNGRLVANLSKDLRPGYNTFMWYLNDEEQQLPPGTYVMKITNGSEVMTKRIVKK